MTICGGDTLNLLIETESRHLVCKSEKETQNEVVMVGKLEIVVS